MQDQPTRIDLYSSRPHRSHYHTAENPSPIHLSQRRAGVSKGCALLIVLLLLACAASGAKAGSSAIVRPDPLVFEVEVGQVGTLNIVLEEAVDVYGIDLRGAFDAQVVEIVDANPVRTGVQMIPGTIPQPDFPVSNSVDEAAGTFQYVVTQVNPTPPASGSGTVVSLQVRGKTTGETALTITNIQIADKNGKPLDVTSQNGTIKVLSTGSLSHVYLPLVRK